MFCRMNKESNEYTSHRFKNKLEIHEHEYGIPFIHKESMNK